MLDVGHPSGCGGRICARRVAGRMTDFTYDAFSIPRERIFGDLATMSSLGTKVVRLEWTGVSMWDAIEPIPGAFRFDLLDRVMEAATDNDLKVVLPISIVPPKWAQAICMTDGVGRRPSSPLSQRVRVFLCYGDHRTRIMAERFVRLTVCRYKEHPATHGWNACDDLEGLDDADCFNAYLVRGFESWLKTEYGSLAQVHDMWEDMRATPQDSDCLTTYPVCLSTKATQDWGNFAAQYTEEIVQWLREVVRSVDSNHVMNASQYCAEDGNVR